MNVLLFKIIEQNCTLKNWDKLNKRTMVNRVVLQTVANHGVSKPWRGTALFVVRFAKKLNRAVAGQGAVRQDTN